MWEPGSEPPGEEHQRGWFFFLTDFQTPPQGRSPGLKNLTLSLLSENLLTTSRGLIPVLRPQRLV